MWMRVRTRVHVYWTLFEQNYFYFDLHFNTSYAPHNVYYQFGTWAQKHSARIWVYWASMHVYRQFLKTFHRLSGLCEQIWFWSHARFNLAQYRDIPFKKSVLPPDSPASVLVLKKCNLTVTFMIQYLKLLNWFVHCSSLSINTFAHFLNRLLWFLLACAKASKITEIAFSMFPWSITEISKWYEFFKNKRKSTHWPKI